MSRPGSVFRSKFIAILIYCSRQRLLIWYELTDPSTERLFYANPHTGQCSWTRPPGRILCVFLKLFSVFIRERKALLLLSPPRLLPLRPSPLPRPCPLRFEFPLILTTSYKIILFSFPYFSKDRAICPLAAVTVSSFLQFPFGFLLCPLFLLNFTFYCIFTRTLFHILKFESIPLAADCFFDAQNLKSLLAWTCHCPLLLASPSF